MTTICKSSQGWTVQLWNETKLRTRLSMKFQGKLWNPIKNAECKSYDEALKKEQDLKLKTPNS